MRILIIGGGGREHALAWKCAQSATVTQVLVAPGNAGTATEPKVRNVAVAADDLPGLLALAQSEHIALTIVDDGVGPTDGSPGLGSSIFNQASTMPWTLTPRSSGSGSVLQVVVAIAPSIATAAI